MKRTDSEFKSSFFGRFLVKWLVTLGNLFSLGLAGPWLICFRQKYMCSHTYINGNRQRFDGRGSDLCKKYYPWYFLSIVTLGVYSIIMNLKIHAWITEHTHFEGKSGESAFDGKALPFWGISVASSIISVSTLGIGSFWTVCWREGYLVNHSVIDGKRLVFTGKGSHLFAKGILWYFLSVITLGIYSFFLAYKQKKWLVYHTEISDVVNELKRYDKSILKKKAIEEKRGSPEWKRCDFWWRLSFVFLAFAVASVVAYAIVTLALPFLMPLRLILALVRLAAVLAHAAVLFATGVFADKVGRQYLNMLTVVWAILLCLYSISLLPSLISLTIALSK